MKFVITAFSLSCVLMATVLLAGCDQYAARHGVGSMDLALPCNQKLVNITWKGEDAQLWYLMRTMTAEDLPDHYTFKGKTTLGVLNGQVNIKEQRC